MKQAAIPEGSRWHRWGLRMLTVLLFVLFAWLMGYVLRDIGTWPGPQWTEVLARHVPAELEQRREALARELEEVGRQTTYEREQLDTLQRSLAETRATMEQFVALHRLSLEKDIAPSAAEQEALAEAERLFMTRQAEFQAGSQRMAELNGRRARANEAMQALGREAAEYEEAARLEFDGLRRAHELKMAGLKLLFIVPVLLAAAWLMGRMRRSAYRPIAQALLAAAGWRVILVMHEHFPERWFKYIAIVAGIAVVLAFMVAMIRRSRAPRPEWLLKQYKEAYDRQRCPVCSHPVRRGPLRHARWSAKGPLGGGVAVAAVAGGTGASATAEGEYTCPACGTEVFKPCAVCGKTRHALLPYCEHCGAESGEGRDVETEKETEQK